MRKWDVRMLSSVWELSVEDIAFAELLETVLLPADVMDAEIQSVIQVLISGNIHDGYRVKVNGDLYCAESVGRERVVALLLDIMGDYLCTEISQTQFLMHAAGVQIKDKVIAIAGAPGSGKSTLAWLLSKYGRYLGDEYAFLNVTKGTIRFTSYPLNIKSGNRWLADIRKENQNVKAIDQTGKVSFYCRMNDSDHDQGEMPIYMILFPHFYKNSINTKIYRLDLRKMPLYVLQSVLGPGAPVQTFRSFISMRSRTGLQFLELHYSDTEDMIQKLIVFLEQDVQIE